MGYSSSFGDQLIRFSYVTNVSSPQESGCIKATYRNLKQIQKYHLTPHRAVNKSCVWFSCKVTHIQDKYSDTTVYIQH